MCAPRARTSFAANNKHKKTRLGRSAYSNQSNQPALPTGGPTGSTVHGNFEELLQLNRATGFFDLGLEFFSFLLVHAFL